MPTDTGVWTKPEVAGQHCFSYRLAEFLATFLPRDKRVFDLGCGLGTYSKYLKDVGFRDVVAIEGEDLEELFETNVRVHDLTEPLDIGPLLPGSVIALEIGEHIPGELMGKFIDNIDTCCDGLLVLSWAIRGQDGYGHINTLDNYEIIGIMQDRGFKFLLGPSRDARAVIENHVSWFKNTILIFQKNA